MNFFHDRCTKLRKALDDKDWERPVVDATYLIFKITCDILVIALLLLAFNLFHSILDPIMKKKEFSLLGRLSFNYADIVEWGDLGTIFVFLTKSVGRFIWSKE